ncbi:HNH endonuclease, partial [Nocardioides koreensis]|uniref:HNH endonuclease n=1 Tax=Nocardioides koreensis TaxID=433651 RepID=UPI0031D6E866
GLVDMFADLQTPTDDAACLEHLEALERVKSAAAAAQARLTDQLDQRRGGTGGRRDAGLGAEIGLARRESPHRGRGHLTLARALLHDLPHTHAALARGDLSERRAEIIATETSHLTREHRLRADTELAADPTRLDGLGETRLQQEARRIVLRLDEQAALARRRRAHTGRRVTGRLLPDGMAALTLTIADWQYAAIMTSLTEAAARARARGDDDERTRGQLQADTAVARLTGQATATAVPVALKILQSAESLLGDDCTPAWIPWCGHVPATLARGLAATAPAVRSTLQRLFHFPDTGALVAMERHTAQFPAELRDFIALRDQTCRTPWCNAPIRHTDHARPRADGGDTSAHNGQGLCESCNYLKENPGWQHHPASG